MNRLSLEEAEFLYYTAACAANGAVFGTIEGWKTEKSAEMARKWTFLFVVGWGLFICIVADNIEFWRVMLGATLVGTASSLGAYGGCKIGQRSQLMACILSGGFAGIIAAAGYYFIL